MGSKHSRARDTRQRKNRVNRRRVMREFAATLKPEADKAGEAKSESK